MYGVVDFDEQPKFFIHGGKFFYWFLQGKDVLILAGKDDSIENIRILTHESINLANSMGPKGQKFTPVPATSTAAKGMRVFNYGLSFVGI